MKEGDKGARVAHATPPVPITVKTDPKYKTTEIFSPDGEEIGLIWAGPRREEYVDLMLRAVNAHDDLLATVETLASAIREFGNGSVELQRFRHEAEALIARAKA